MRNLILICLLLLSSACLAFNEQTAQFPEAVFKSVNTYSCGVSYQSHITPVGATELYGTNNTTHKQSKPRRVDGVNNNPDDPMMDPIGDAPLIFVLGLGVLYILVIRKKERVED